jgi:hypothetical protein
MICMVQEQFRKLILVMEESVQDYGDIRTTRKETERKMSTGFGSDAKNANITIDLDYVDVILKQYKKIKKYKKSSLYTIKTMDGTETLISSLIKEAEDNPLD